MWRLTPQNKMAPRPGMAKYFREELRRLWEQGCQNGKQILVEVRELGYIGSYSGLTRLLSEWREEKRAAEKAAVAATQPAEQKQVGGIRDAERFSARSGGGAEQTETDAE